MLSTRFTGSSTNMTVESSRSAASSVSSAPGAAKCSAMNARLGSWSSSHSGSKMSASSACGRSVNTAAYASGPRSRGTAASGGYQS
jgi:hypothetical protein